MKIEPWDNQTLINVAMGLMLLFAAMIVYEQATTFTAYCTFSCDKLGGNVTSQSAFSCNCFIPKNNTKDCVSPTINANFSIFPLRSVP